MPQTSSDQPPDAGGLSHLRDWLPANAIMLANLLLHRGIRFKGTFATWEEARARAAGYETASILKQALPSAQAARDGKAQYERDGLLFSTHTDPFPLLTALLRVAAARGGRLHVLDFGGALGSTYFQCRRWLEGLAHLRWTIVEQPHFVAAGCKQLSSDVLRFAGTVEEAAAQERVDVALFSGVLQYLSEPASVLRQVATMGVPNIIIDRTPFIRGPSSLLTVQLVPAHIVKSSYPARLFVRGDILQPVGAEYKVLSEFHALDRSVYSLGRRIDFRGIILTRYRSHNS